jgi:hypothetical protein
MGIAVHARQEVFHVARHLARAVQAATCVVQVDLLVLVKPRKFAVPEGFEIAVVGQIGSVDQLLKEQGVQ